MYLVKRIKDLCCGSNSGSQNTKSGTATVKCVDV